MTSGGQAELGRALGGYVNVVTKSGTNVAARHRLRLRPRRPLQRAERAVRHEAADGPVAVRRRASAGRSCANRTFYFTNVEQRRLDQTGLTTISAANVAAINARLAAVGYQGPPVATGHLSESGRFDERARARSTIRSAAAISSASATACTTSTPQNSRGAGGLNAPSASSALDNLDQTIAVSNTLTCRRARCSRRGRSSRTAISQAPPTDPIGPAVSIAGVASFGTSSGSPTRRVNRMYQVVNNLSHQAGAHAFRAGVDFLYNDDRITYPRAVRGSYTFSSLANFLPASTTTPASRRRSARPRSRRPIPTSACTRRTNGRSAARHVEPRRALRPAVPRDDRHRHQQRLAARGRRVVAVRVAPHDRPRQRRASSTIACRCARSPTRCSRPATRPIWRTCGRSP